MSKDCRKFQANIFNKSKCTNCFRQREEHSAEALESNRASRKVSKCGYLFVAPDWDFAIPLNRTKRWQRRWFVLYDDGELTYSLDDHPATIPQGVVDMTRVLEVSEAEEVTGNQFSLAITAPDRVTFVKGTCKEEARWWMDVLGVLPRTHKQGRHKRNATFPGIKTSSVVKQSRSLHSPPATLAPTTFETTLSQRVRFHSCTADTAPRPHSLPALEPDEDVFPTKDSPPPSSTSSTPSSTSSANTIPSSSSSVASSSSSSATSNHYHSSPLSSLPPASNPISSLLSPSSTSSSSSARVLRDEHKENTPPYCEDYSDNPPTSESPPTQDKLSHKLRTRRTVRREARGLTTPRSPGEVSRRQLLTDLEESKREEKLKDIADSITRLRGSPAIASYLASPKPGVGDVKPTRECDLADEPEDPPTPTCVPPSPTKDPTLHNTLPDHVRGDPDGCGLEVTPPYHPSGPDLPRLDPPRVDLPAEDLLYIKKGWLMKQSLTQEWTKYWFVLRGSCLAYHRDPAAEDAGLMDGLIDLSAAHTVHECEVARNYGFAIMTWEEKQYIFSAVTSGIRANWVQALRNAANLKDAPNRPLTLGEKIEREIVAKRSNIESMAAERDQSETKKTDSPRRKDPTDPILHSSDDEGGGGGEEGDGDDEEEEEEEEEEDEADEEDYRTASEPSTPATSNSRLHKPPADDVLDWGRARTRPDPRPSNQRSRSSPPPQRRTTTSSTNAVSSKPSSGSNSSGSREDMCCSESGGSLRSITDLDDKNQPEKDCGGVNVSSSGDALLVDLLETQVESLKAKLEQTQVKELMGRVEAQEQDLSDKASSVSELRHLQNKYEEVVQRLTTQQDLYGGLDWKHQYDLLEKKYIREREEWEERLSTEEQRHRESAASLNSRHHDVVNRLNRSLQEAEKRLHVVAGELDRERAGGGGGGGGQRKGGVGALDPGGLRRLNQELTTQLEETRLEVARLKDNLKSEKSEVYKWKDLVKELRSLLDGKNDEIDRKRDEVDSLRERVRSSQRELEATADRLHCGIEENESLCARVRELQRGGQERRASSNLSISSSRERVKRSLPRIDSISDLTNIDLLLHPEHLDKEQLADEYSELGLRFERAVSEIRALKRELREVQGQYDQAELTIIQLRQDLQAGRTDFHSQLGLMTSRVQDLTNKLSASEKQVRVLRQKVSRAESRDRRRTQSLKGRESFTLARDMEVKLAALEARVNHLARPDLLQPEEDSKPPSSGSTPQTPEVEPGSSHQTLSSEARQAKRSRSFDESTKSSRLRRKSLDSPASSDAVRAIVRLNTLEAKVTSLAGDGGTATPPGETTTSTSTSVTVTASTKSTPRPKSPTHPASPLKSPLRSPSLGRKGVRSPRVTPDKVMRSDSQSKQQLRERLAALEKLLSTLQAQLSECVSWAGSVESVCTCGAPGLSSLTQQLWGAVRLSQLRQAGPSPGQLARCRPVALRILDLLRDKMADLAARRAALKASGKWSREAQMKLVAERLAYEAVVAGQVGQVGQAALRPHLHAASARLQDLVEVHRKLSFLEKKLTNPDFDMDSLTPLDFYTSLLAEKLVVQGEVASSLAGYKTTWATSKGEVGSSLAGSKTSGATSKTIAAQTPPSPALAETCRDLEGRLLEREKRLAGLVTHYKDTKLQQIAVVMARETVTGTGPAVDENVLVEEVRMREVWCLAQEAVCQELASAEASQSLLRLANLLVPAGPPPPPPASTTPITSSTGPERWQAGAEESLRQEMEEAVLTLSNKYEAVLARHRAGDTTIVNSVTNTMETLLAELAAVLAQKALIDGQLAAVQGEGVEGSGAAEETLAIVEETRDPVGAVGDVAASEAHLLMFLGGCDSSLESLVQPALDQAEFTFLYQQAAGRATADISTLISTVPNIPSESEIAQTSLPSTPTSISSSSQAALVSSLASSASKLPASPKMRRRGSDGRRLRRASDVTGMTDGCRNCDDLRAEVARLRRIGGDSKRTRERQADCPHCQHHVAKLKAVEEEHKAVLAVLQSKHQLEITRIRQEALTASGGGDLNPIDASSDASLPTRDTPGELTELKRRLSLLEEGYEAQISALKQQYQEALGSHPDLSEEKLRQRYQLEIEHLRGLCEKGFGAMETSHKRVVSELEEQHRRELTALQAEKDQALAEETQATLAALDAMRKAHEAEVIREIAKFKEEFVRRTEGGEDLGALQRQHQAEVEEIRREILSISEKYSVKCLEAASLEERVEGLGRQLAEANRLVFDLEARNKQLLAHLSARVAQLQTEGVNEPSNELRLREAELALRQEEVARLTHQLYQSQSHETDLGELCRQLGHFLKAERQLRTDEVSALRDKLEAIILTAAAMQEHRECGGEVTSTSSAGVTTDHQQQQQQQSSTVNSRPTLRRPSVTTRTKELIRSPSCPRLSGVSSFLSVGPSEVGGGGTSGQPQLNPLPPTPTSDLPSPLTGMVANRKKVFETHRISLTESV